jgi:hypothetical protein
MKRQIGSPLSVIDADRSTDRDAMKQERRAGHEHMQDLIRKNEEKIRSERDETIKQRVENVVTHLIHETQSLQRRPPATKRRRQIQGRFIPL